METRELYWKYSLIVIVLLLGAVLFVKFIPYMAGILGAFTVYILTRNQMKNLRSRKHIGSTFAAILILVEVVLCFLIPCSLAIWLLVNKIQSINLDPSQLVESAEHLCTVIQAKTGYDITSPDTLQSVLSYLPKLGQSIVGEVSGFAINVATMFLFLYFFLIWGEKMENYIIDILPFSDKNKRYVLSQIKIIVTSNAIGIPLLAVIQGAVALVGFIIFGAPSPFIFAFVTCFATLIPVIGTSLVWFPLAVYLILIGNWPHGVGLALYGFLVVTNVDNLTRFMLQKKLADINPLVTIFGVLIGLSLFGFMGIIFGPLLISIFIVCFNMLKIEYIDKSEIPGP